MATATFRLDFDTPTSGNGQLWITWAESVSGFARGDIRASHPLIIGALIPHGNNVYEYRFFLRNSNDRDDLYFTIPANAVTQGNPLYTFPSQASAPDAPTSLTATVTGKSIELSWTASASDGNSAITRYEYRYAKGATAGGTWTSTGGTGTTFTVTGLDPNQQYTFEVRAVNAIGTSDASNAVSATTEIVAPDAPRTLTGTAAATSVALGWVAPASTGGAAIKRYEYRVAKGKTAGGTWTSTGGTSRSFTVTGLEKGTEYTFQVRAVNDIDADTEGFSEGSNTVTLTIDTTVPGVPTDLTVTPDGLGFDVSWKAPVDDGGTPITKYEYRYRRGRTAGGTWTSVGTQTSVSVSGLQGNTRYTFQVRAVNAEGNSVNSAAVTGRTERVAPDAPTGLTAVLTSTTAAVSWTAPASNGGSVITRYEYRYAKGKSAGGTWTTTGGTGRSFTITGLDRNTEYTFQVRAVNAVGNSDPSNTDTETTSQTDVTAPRTFKVVPTATTAVLTWTAPAQTEGAEIRRYEYRYVAGDTISGNWTSAGTALTATLTGLDKGTEYAFQVRAVIAAGAGISSGVVTATTGTTVPGAPTGLAVTPAKTSAVLTWTAPVDAGGTALLRYEYRYRVSGGSWESWTSTGGTELTVTVTGFTGNTSYEFEVRAVNAEGNSDASDSVTEKTTPVVPAAPGALTVQTTATTAVLTWTAPSDDGGAPITEYEYRRGRSGRWISAGTALTATITGLDKGTAYTFQVRAVNRIGNSPNRQQTATTETTIPSAPRNFTATPSATSVRLRWAAPADIGGTPITKYEYRRGTSGDWVSAGTALTATVTGLDKGTAYTFEVRAVNAKGESPIATLNTRTTHTIPTAPRGLTLTPTETRISVIWQAPVDDGGTPITKYEYRYQRGSGLWSTWTSAGTALTVAITGLVKGTRYAVAVRAVNAEGNSPTVSTTVTTLTTVPTAPRTFTAKPIGTSVALSWAAPSDNGGTGILRYETRYWRVGGNWTSWASAGRSLSRTVSRLIAKTRYTFEVRAVNAKGNSPAASASALTSQPVPGAPTAVTVVILSGTTALLKWKSPGDITGFQVNWAAGSSISSNWRRGRGRQTSYLVTGLNRQTQYAFAVRGVNSAGTGARSQIKTARTPIASPHNALFFKECVNYIGGGVRVKKHGNPSQIIRAVADNDYGTFSEEKDYTVDISRNGAATRVDAFFVKCKGVSRHSGTPSGGSGSGWTHVTVPATVRNYEGRSVSTTVAGFQHHLLLLNSHFTAKSVRLQFQGSGVRIYEVMLLEFGLEIDANGDFTEIAPDFVDRSGEIRSGPGGRLSYGAPIGAGRDTWEIAYGVEVVPGKTLLQTPQAFLYWRSENRNHVHAMEPSRFPWRLFPATFVGDRVPVRYRTDDKMAGEILSFSVAER